MNGYFRAIFSIVLGLNAFACKKSSDSTAAAARFAVIAPASDTRTFFECTPLTLAIAGVIDADADEDGQTQGADTDFDLASAGDGLFYSDDECDDESATATMAAGDTSVVHYYRSYAFGDDTITLSTDGLDDAEAELTTDSSYDGTWTTGCIDDVLNTPDYKIYTYEISGESLEITEAAHGNSSCTDLNVTTVSEYEIGYGDVLEDGLREIDLTLTTIASKAASSGVATALNSFCPSVTFPVGEFKDYTNADCSGLAGFITDADTTMYTLWKVNGDSLNTGLSDFRANVATSSEASRRTAVSTTGRSSFTK